jgi:CubicO group peptidase (beta-lactamase class C family)
MLVAPHLGVVRIAVFASALGAATPDAVGAVEDLQFSAALRPDVHLQGVAQRWHTLGERMVHHRVPGVSVAVVKDGRLLWARGFGVATQGTPEAVTSTTLFQAASISKPITATTALRLVDRGTLSLDDDVSGFLKSWRLPDSAFTAVEKVTIRRILSHTAGLTVPTFSGYGVGDRLPTVLEILSGRTPATTDPVRVFAVPGSLCRYSGGGYTVLQTILTDATRTPFGQLVKEEVFDPIGMADSTFDDPLPARLRTRASSGHRATGKPIPGGHLVHPQLAAAGLWSTPADLLKWAAAMAAARAGKPGSLLSQPTATQMLTRQKGSVVGLGPFVKGSGTSLEFSHQGWTTGFHSRLVYFPETGQGAAVMANGVGGRALVSEILGSIATAYSWPTVAAPLAVEALAMPASTLARVVGEYEGGAPIKVVATLRRRGRELFLDAPELGPETRAVFTTATELITLDGGDRFALRTNGRGTVSSLVWGDVELKRRPANRPSQSLEPR